MKNLKCLVVFLLVLANTTIAAAQGDVMEQSETYIWPDDSLVVDNLKQWQDQKFGVLIHWGLYAVPGIVESWSICDEDWITRDTTMTYQQYMDWYFSLAEEFNPNLFDASQWAKACQDAGMRYMIFTTKHHDGFCMYDSRETDFTIARHAFRNDSRRDVLKHVVDAFRQKGFGIGTYFSKPDWHSQDYWWDVYSKKGRGVNYPVAQHPERWNRFCRFTHRQIEEILTGYGQVDILWLDGGWVWPGNRGQDIDMPGIADMARCCQPGIIIVDRTIGGPYENYLTPERTIPDSCLNYPWESCIPLSDDWGYVKKPRWKSARKVINTLVEIVAKGGNLVLGIGPTPDGLIQPEAVDRLHQIGEWLRKNGKAIYSTVPARRYHDGGIWFTTSKDGKQTYAICPLEEGQKVPSTISWKGNTPRGSVRLLATGRKLKTVVKGDSVSVSLPKNMQNQTFVLEMNTVGR
ncbi:MAG: alpha-L-fucosidase [Prevotella sp.]|nr:alpha-L-fucosidase [Prevotella sp.]